MNKGGEQTNEKMKNKSVNQMKKKMCTDGDCHYVNRLV